MKSVRAKKALGQHFLTDLKVAEKIADSLRGIAPYPILEIGPGMGVLTQFLLPRYPDVKVVEIDTESVTYLKATMPALEGRIIEGDFLKMDLAQVYSGAPFLVIGNFPYNISSQIFFKILEQKELIPAAGGMLQKEVAQRLASPPGSKEYGILSVLLQAWYDVNYLFTVGREVFDPPPKVLSGVISIIRNDRKELGCDEALFKKVVKATFNQRRKTIRNSIRQITGDSTLPTQAESLLKERPERLGVEEFVLLTRVVEQTLKEANNERVRT